ncbi:MAG: SDR family oxidoreductase, partial [Actinobacteria bacterium]|nr:SDR family oxidoreductase [Actinomycetota bacterium]
MSRIVVLGGAGFLGSHLCDALVKRGDEVVAVDNFSTGSKANLQQLNTAKNFSVVDADICEPIEIAGRVELVFNFASPASPKKYLQIPIQTLQAGSLGTENAVQLALKNNARLIMASTSEVYGDPLTTPQSETYFGNVNPIGVRSCYDEAKRFAEALLMAHSRVSGLNLGIVRIFNTYGPRLDPDDGRVVSTLISQAVSNQDLTVHGDGKQSRSFCYVDDLIRGVIALADSNEIGPINLGNDKEISVLELANLVLKINQSSNKITFTQAMDDDPQQRCPDLTLAKSKLNWSPTISVEYGLSRTIEWFRSIRHE